MLRYWLLLLWMKSCNHARPEAHRHPGLAFLRGVGGGKAQGHDLRAVSVSVLDINPRCKLLRSRHFKTRGVAGGDQFALRYGSQRGEQLPLRQWQRTQLHMEAYIWSPTDQVDVLGIPANNHVNVQTGTRYNGKAYQSSNHRSLSWIKGRTSRSISNSSLPSIAKTRRQNFHWRLCRPSQVQRLRRRRADVLGRQQSEQRWESHSSVCS